MATVFVYAQRAPARAQLARIALSARPPAPAVIDTLARLRGVASMAIFLILAPRVGT
jgi:hypothetical protein